MASACVNNIGENFLDCSATYPSYGWLSPSPRVSCSRDNPDEEKSKIAGVNSPSSANPPEESDLVDFEFRLEDPVMMLPADELFSDGKLVPSQLHMFRSAAASESSSRLPDTPTSCRRMEISSTDPYLFSPKAPRCSSRWKEILGLKKLYQNSNAKQENGQTTKTTSHSISTTKSLKNFLHRNSNSNSKSSTYTLDSSLNVPLLKDSDNESLSISSRLSLSSSSSGHDHDHDDLPRLSLDSEKPNPTTLPRNPNTNPPRVRVGKTRSVSSDNPRVGRSPLRRQPETSQASIDSPRMNSSGKIVFHSLERSSSSPSSFNAGPRFKYKGVERSYSAHVRVTPVLNVPVCSLRGSSKFGFPLFSAPHKREGATTNGGSKTQHCNSKNRADRL